MKTNEKLSRSIRQGGFLYLFIALVIIAVTAVVSYKIVTSGKTIMNNHTSQLTNEMSYNEIWQQYYGPGNEFASDILWFTGCGEDLPPMQFTSTTPVPAVYGPGFGFQYVINDYHGQPIMLTGTNRDSGQSYIDYQASTETGFLTGDYYGSGEHLKFDSSDPDYVIPVTIDTNMSTVLIQRSIDFQNWVPIGTNDQYLRWTVETFVDTNAPASGAFYRAVVVPNDWNQRQYETQ